MNVMTARQLAAKGKTHKHDTFEQIRCRPTGDGR
jgi:hypothetical protein